MVDTEREGEGEKGRTVEKERKEGEEEGKKKGKEKGNREKWERSRVEGREGRGKEVK